MKRKIDLEIKLISEYLKNQLNLYQARGVGFEMNFEDNTRLELNEDITNSICTDRGILPLFTIEMDLFYKQLTKKEDGLPFVYYYDKTALLERTVEISENINLSKKAFLTQSLAILDYVLEEKIRNAYVLSFPGKDPNIEFKNKTPILVDFTELYDNYRKESLENNYIMFPQPKSERIKSNDIYTSPSPSSKTLK